VGRYLYVYQRNTFVSGQKWQISGNLSLQRSMACESAIRMMVVE
jgi:hypothetical protein